MDNIRHISEHPSARSPSAQSPAGMDLAIALLSSCLALVRPVGMGEAETAEWLGVAAGDVCHYPPSILDRACLEARRTCTHHSQIVPTIVKEADALTAREASLREASVPSNLHVLPQPARLPAPKLTQADVDRMPAKLREIGLKCGALVQDADGTITPTPEQAA